MRKLFFVSLFLAGNLLSAQDTVRVMFYNLLNYGNYTSYCNSTNNFHETKEKHFRTVIDYAKPDIVGACEINRLPFYHNRFRDEVLNTSGRDYFLRADIINTAASSLVNQLYYDSRKFVLQSQEVLQTQLRDIDLYTLYLKDDKLASGDTTFLHCIVAHLKAGSNITDMNERTQMVTTAMKTLSERKKPGNFLIMGDFNLKSAGETAYQRMTYEAPAGYRFFDPVNQEGEWNRNYDYRFWHTQSGSTLGGECMAGGGLDDRFDLVLASEALMQGTRGLKYVADTYTTLGQDGQHFGSLIYSTPTNTSAPVDVIQALAAASDHLPVSLKLVTKSTITASRYQRLAADARVIRMDAGTLEVWLNETGTGNIDWAIISMNGQRVDAGSANGTDRVIIRHKSLKPGVYLLQLNRKGNLSAVKFYE